MTKKANQQNIPGLVERLENFSNTSGTLKAGRPTNILVRQFLAGDVLNEDEKSRLLLDLEQAGIQYLVMSYETLPLMWVTKTGWVYKVKQTLTQTSQQHMRLLDGLSEGYHSEFDNSGPTRR